MSNATAVAVATNASLERLKPSNAADRCRPDCRPGRPAGLTPRQRPRRQRPENACAGLGPSLHWPRQIAGGHRIEESAIGCWPGVEARPPVNPPAALVRPKLQKTRRSISPFSSQRRTAVAMTCGIDTAATPDWYRPAMPESVSAGFRYRSPSPQRCLQRQRQWRSRGRRTTWAPHFQALQVVSRRPFARQCRLAGIRLAFRCGRGISNCAILGEDGTGR